MCILDMPISHYVLNPYIHSHSALIVHSFSEDFTELSCRSKSFCTVAMTSLAVTSASISFLHRGHSTTF